MATRRANIAALDALTWRNIEMFEAFTSQLRVLAWTNPTPGLPLITAWNNDADLIFEAVEGAINALNNQDPSRLGIKGIVKISKEEYLSLRNPD